MSGRQVRVIRGYFICSTPRSGSNYVCQVLESTGALGHALEYFNPAARRALEALDYPDDARAQMRWILGHGSTPNGVYGLKVFPDQLARTLQAVDVFAHLPNPVFVRLQRRDLLGQAISWARALQTQQYRSTQIAQDEPAYDADAIAAQLQEIVRLTASWELYFARTATPAPVVYYEDVEANPAAIIASVAALVGIEGVLQFDAAKVSVRRQRDASTEVWRQRFLDERGARNVLELLVGRA
jgi:LPS sulfotransferase NodH